MRPASPIHVRLSRAFALLLLPAFLLVFPYIGTINNPNENVRAYMTMAIVEDHSFQLDGVVSRYGWVNDMAKVSKADGSSHYYCIKGPAIGYMGIPVYAAFRQISAWVGRPPPSASATVEVQRRWLRDSLVCLRLFVVQLPCFLFVLALERWLRRYTGDPIVRWSATLAACVGTNYLAYSLMFVSHALVAVTSFSAFALIASQDEDILAPSGRRRSAAFVAGLLAGVASMLDYQAFVLSAGLALYAAYVFRRPAQFSAFVVGAGLCAGALMYYQWACFGNALMPGYKFAETPEFAAYHAQGFYGLTLPDASVLRRLSFSHAYGFFGTSPFMYLGLLALPAAFLLGGDLHQVRARRIATAVWVTLMAILWLAMSSAVHWRGGWVVGPRYLGAAPPFFAFGAVLGLEALARRFGAARTCVRAAAVGLGLASIVQIGLVSLHFNSLPEDVTRPLVEVSWPLMMAGFVPYHIGDLLGLPAWWVWHVIAALMLLPMGVLAVLRLGERPIHLMARLLGTIVIAAVGFAGALSSPDPTEGGDAGLEARRMFVSSWEPSGRDRLSRARQRAEGNDPCAWRSLAAIERTLRLPEADVDERRAPAECWLREKTESGR